MSRVQIRLSRCAGLSAPLLFADKKKNSLITWIIWASSRQNRSEKARLKPVSSAIETS